MTMNPVHLVELLSIFVLAFFAGLERRTGNWRPVLALGLTLMAAAWVGEDSCIRLYGFYEYTPEWHGILDKMPLMVALIWPFVILSDLRVVESVLGAGHRALPWVTGALVCYDAALMEAVSVRSGLWHWNEPGLFDVPLIGVLGWGYFAATSLWFWQHLRGWARAGILLLAPIATHLMLLVTWWGALRWWPRGPLDSSHVVLVAALVSLALSVGIWVRGVRVPFQNMLPRLPAAGVFFLLLFLFGREDLWLVAFVLSFAPPYMLATRLPSWRSWRKRELPSTSGTL